MQVSVQVSINRSREDIWKTITDIESWADTVSGIEELEILERPESALVGLKWKETRTMFGKKATEVMWVTDATDHESYDVRAESHGSVYESRLSIADEGTGHVLRMDFEAQAQGFIAKILSPIFGVFFKGAAKKALLKDLEDIKAAVEAGQ